MGVQVTFDYPTWAAQFPALAPYINSTQATASFNIATLFQDNTGCGPINDAGIQLSLLNLLTAHIATLTYPTTGPIPGGSQPSDPVSPLVGRISSAGEGSVNVSAENAYPQGSPQWYQQTKWGSMWWEATAQFRTVQYTIPRWRRTGPWGPFGFRLGFG